MRIPTAQNVTGKVQPSPPVGSPDRGGGFRCRAFDIALGVLIAAVPLSLAPLAPHSFKWAILGSLVPLLAILWLWGGTASLRPLPRLAAPLLALLLASVVSLLQAVNLHYGLQRIAFLLVLFMVYLIVAYCAEPDRQDTFLRYLLLTLLVVSGLSLTGCALQLPFPLVTPVGMLMRMLGNTNYAAAYLLTIIPLSVALYVRTPWGFEKAIYGAIMFLSMVLLPLSMVRGAWVSIPIGLGVVAVVLFYEKGSPVRGVPRLRQASTLVLICSGVLLGVLLWPVCLPGELSFGERLASTFDPGAAGLHWRLITWQGTLRMIRDHFWTGVGIGNFALAFVPYRTPIHYRNPTRQAWHPHNEYLNMWAELGPLGVLAFAWLLITVIRLGWTLLGRSGARRGVLAGILGGLAASAAYANLFYVVHVPASAMNVAILLGLLDGMGREVKREGKGPLVRLRVLVPALLIMGAFWFQYFLTPLAGEIHYFLAQRDFRHERTEAGLRQLDQSLAWNPQSHAVRYRRAIALFSQGRYPETIDEAHKALQIHPNLEVAYWVMGSAYRKLGKNQMAKEMFLQALDINPYYVHPLNNLGVMAAQAGRIAEAETFFMRAKEIVDRSDIGPYTNLGNLYETTGRMPEALRMYEAAVAIKPRSAGTWYKVARLRTKIGDPKGAYTALARVIALDEAWRARAVKDSAFAAMRASDARVRVLLRLE